MYPDRSPHDREVVALVPAEVHELVAVLGQHIDWALKAAAVLALREAVEPTGGI